MGTVFLKNATSSSITVAGHKVYYIDSADAEIVEVEGTAPLEILLGFKWNSDSSELEAVDISNDAYWSRVISQHDKELLQSLGLFVDVDFLKYGSLKKDSSYTYTIIGVYTGIGEGEISADLLSHFTVGISSAHPTYPNVARIICDTSVPVLVKTWKCRVSISVTNKYNAFKYTLNGTPYYYVIDGTHDTWTDDLSAWGYSEVQPVVELPTVSVLNSLGVTTSGSDTPQTVASGGTSFNLKYWSSGGWYGSYEPFDSTKCYAIVKYGKESGVWLSPCGVFEPVDGSGNISAKNVSQASQVFRSAQIAVCSSNLATVVTVYNSSNTSYNAFKYTANNVDYYYVLDGTQTDWVSDLASIGYSLYLTAWVTDNQSATNVGSGIYGFYLYDSSGVRIGYDSGKTYTLVAYYASESGTRQPIPSTLNLTHSTYNGTERLYVYNYPGQIAIQRIEYTVS